jgi:hypothetical protein
VVALALLLASRALRPSSSALAVAVVAIADLALAQPWPNPTAPVALYAHRPEVLRALDGPETRVYAYDYGERWPDAAWSRDRPDRLASVPAGWRLDAASALAQQMSLAPQTAGRWRLRQGFDVDYRGLQAAPLASFTQMVRVVEDRPEDVVRLLRLASVTHVVALHDVAPGQLRAVGEIPGLFVAPVRAFAVDGALPRARVVGGVRVADGPEAARLLLVAGFDPAREVLLASGSAVASPAGFVGRASIVAERSDRVLVDVELSHDGHLLLADSFDEGWRARVDGREAAVLRADMAFRAVALSPGRHVVEMRYRPPRVLAAVLVTFASLATGLVLLLVRRDRP